MGPRNVNSKVEAGRAKKAAVEAEKSAKAAAVREAQEARDWQKGANVRGASRAEDNAAKADEAARKRAEKAALLAAEEAELGPGGKIKAVPNKRKSSKKKNDLSLLEDALVGAAEKKTRQQKRASQLKKEKEEQLAKQRAEKEKDETMDPLLQNTEAMIEGAVGRQVNVQSMGETSGLDGALGQLDITTGTEVKSGKALYAAFEEKMLPEMREDYPGLKLSQYKERIFNAWKKSPENPRNQALSE